MPAAEMRYAISRLRRTQKALSSETGVPDKTLREWLGGKPIPAAAARFFRIAVRHPEYLELVEAAGEPLAFEEPMPIFGTGFGLDKVLRIANRAPTAARPS